jgi:hypothetical protein
VDTPGTIASAVAKHLEGGQVHGKSKTFWTEGRFRGYSVTAKCWGMGTSGWLVHADAPEGAPPLLLSAQVRSTGDQAAVERGSVRAVVTGDASFDATWIVEGSPAATVRFVIDPEARAGIGRLRRSGVGFLGQRASSISVEDGRVSARFDGMEYEPSEIVGAIEVVVHVCARLGVMARERKETPPTAAQLAAEQAELAELRALRDRWWARASWPGRVAAVLLASVLTLAALGFLYGSCVPS